MVNNERKEESCYETTKASIHTVIRLFTCKLLGLQDISK